MNLDLWQQIIDLIHQGFAFRRGILPEKAENKMMGVKKFYIRDMSLNMQQTANFIEKLLKEAKEILKIDIKVKIITI